jgi:hypothetical protein
MRIQQRQLVLRTIAHTNHRIAVKSKHRKATALASQGDDARPEARSLEKNANNSCSGKSRMLHTIYKPHKL